LVKSLTPERLDFARKAIPERLHADVTLALFDIMHLHGLHLPAERNASGFPDGHEEGHENGHEDQADRGGGHAAAALRPRELTFEVLDRLLQFPIKALLVLGNEPPREVRARDLDAAFTAFGRAKRDGLSCLPFKPFARWRSVDSGLETRSWWETYPRPKPYPRPLTLNPTLDPKP